MKRALAAIVIALFALAHPTVTTAAGVIDEQYSLNGQGDNRNKVGVFFEESVDTLRMPTLLFANAMDKDKPSQGIDFCSSLEDPKCSTAQSVLYYALLPPCKSLLEADCIESIYAIVPGSPARIRGVYRESVPNKVANPYKADPENGLPQGSVAGVWEIPNVKHGGNTADYVAIVSRVGAIKREGTKWVATSNGKISRDGDFRAAIFPTKIIRDARYKSNTAKISPRLDANFNSVQIGHPSQLPFDVCAVVGDGVCAMRQAFPGNIKFGMVIRFSKVINGWMHGRIDSPEIDYELTSYGTRIDMKGEATRVPILAGWAFPSDFSESDRRQHSYLNNADGSGIYPGASGDYSMDQLIIWSKVLKDKAAANPTQWIFYDLSERDIASSSACIKSSKTLAGFVTTNSTTYTATPPIYNEQTGTLDYKVASPHFLADGKVFQGKYNLYIDSKVARCIYKFSNAPISASVSITSSDGGQQNVATTVVNEDNGWLHLSATGFTFSSPTLKVKLTQDGSIGTPTPQPSAKPSASAEPQVAAIPVMKKSTITCVKGKTTKKVSAVSPKCPAGFKKKA